MKILVAFLENRQNIILKLLISVVGFEKIIRIISMLADLDEFCLLKGFYSFFIDICMEGVKKGTIEPIQKAQEVEKKIWAKTMISSK